MNIEVGAAHRRTGSLVQAVEQSELDVTGPEAPYAITETRPDHVIALEAELAHLRDRSTRTEAEVANIRVRNRRDVEEARQFAIQHFATDVVEMAESLRRRVAGMPTRSDREPEIVTRLRDGFSGRTSEWTLYGRLLRPAMIVVSAASPKSRNPQRMPHRRPPTCNGGLRATEPNL